MKRYQTYNQRFYNSIPLAIIFSIAMGITLYYLNKFLFFRIQVSVIYLLLGYGIGLFIAKIGRGVSMRFKVLALGCYVLALLVGEVVLVALFNQIDIFLVMRLYLSSLLQLNSILALLMRVLGGLVAFYSAI